MLLAALYGGCAANDPKYLAEGQAFAEASVAAIAKPWTADELIKRADPEFLKEPGPLVVSLPSNTQVHDAGGSFQ